jgi:hypothetical protein
MVYPTSLFNRIKYWFWHFFTPYHPTLRDLLLKLRILRHEGRQDYLIGTVAPHTSIETIVAYLIEEGYQNHFVAWRDDGEVMSLRYVDSFEYQYHIRVFEDGEVRAHYEYTTEHRPLLHLRGIGMEDRREHFLALLGDRIIPS